MRAQEIVERALAQAGPCQLAVMVHETSRVNLRWAANGLTTNGDTASQQADVVAMHPDGGSATTSGHVADDADVDALLARAVTAAAHAAPPPDRSPLPDGGAAPDWHEPPPATSAAILTGLADQLGEAFRRAATDGVEHFGYAEHELATVYLGTSAGTRLRHVQPQGRVELTAQSHGRSRSSWIGLAPPDMVVDVAAADDELRRHLGWQDRRVDVAPGRHPVLLSPSAVADLMIEAYWSMDAQAALEGRSVFAREAGSTRVGEQFGGAVTLASDPAHPGPGMACAPFETAAASSDASSTYDNGWPLGRTEWIREGRLEHLMTTRYSAKRAGLPVTPGIDNLALTVPGASGSLADLVARTREGLLVTCLWYNRVVDPQSLLITGLTRDGVYVVRDGEVVGASGNFRFNESPVSMLGRIVGGATEQRTLAREMGDYFNRAMMPPLLVADINMSTASEAL